MNTTFRSIRNQKLKQYFLEVLEHYPSLHHCPITLVQRRVKGSTMQAQPVLEWRGWVPRQRYRIRMGVYVRDSEALRMEELPEDVLKGWFAHELGHIVDYNLRNFGQMILYGLKYTLLPAFRKKVEHEADYIAMRHGFFSEIIATKRFLLSHELIPEAYKRKLNRYYMPISEVELCMEEGLL